MNTYHGSAKQVSAITSRGAFGGLFSSVDERAAASHGDVLHVIASPKPLTDYALNYEVEGAWEAAVKVCGGDEDRAEAVLSPGCECDSDDPEDGLELQRLRGVLAASLGFTSVEMRDEHGTTWLCLPGCEIAAA